MFKQLLVLLGFASPLSVLRAEGEAALAVFGEAKAKLESLKVKIETEAEKSEVEIMKHTQLLSALSHEKAKALAVIKRLEDLLNPVDPAPAQDQNGDDSKAS